MVLGSKQNMKDILVIVMVMGILLFGCTQEQSSSEWEATPPTQPPAPEVVPQPPAEPAVEPTETEPPAPEAEPAPEPEPDPICIDTGEGKVIYNGHEYEDYCISHNVIFGYYCENDVLKHTQTVCAATEKCENAVCVENEEHECTDTDGGKSVHKKGTVTYWSGGEEYSETDKCYDDYSVLEVWCTDSGTVGFGIIECDHDERCENGRCIDD